MPYILDGKGQVLASSILQKEFEEILCKFQFC